MVFSGTHFQKKPCSLTYSHQMINAADGQGFFIHAPDISFRSGCAGS
jgi:hypothetical protein